jgi:hypothetical protein
LPQNPFGRATDHTRDRCGSYLKNKTMRNLLLLSIVLLIGCNQVNKSETNENVKKDSSGVSKIDTVTTLVIKSKVAVFIFPDTVWLAKQQESTSEDDWNEIVSDATYYDDQAETYLKKNNIPVFHLVNKQFIRFEKANGEVMNILVDTINDGFSCWLFNPNRNPISFKDTEIDDEYDKAFK